MILKNFLRLAAALALAYSPAVAGEVSSQFDVTLTIQPGCVVGTAGDLDFGTPSFLNTEIPASTSFTIQCTSGTPGTISLDDGQGTGTHTTRTLQVNGTGTDEIEYGLYTNETYSTYWGNGTNGGSTVTHSGTGNETNLTIYGRTSIQGAPAEGTYSDIITIAVTY